MYYAYVLLLTFSMVGLLFLIWILVIFKPTKQQLKNFLQKIKNIFSKLKPKRRKKKEGVSRETK